MKFSRKSSSRVVPLSAPLFFYEVAEYGTISDPSVPASKLRAEVFHGVSPAFIGSTDDLISEVEGCSPLASHFSILAADHLSDIEEELDADALGFVERRRLAFLVAALRDDPDTGWRDWVEYEGDAGLASFKEIIQDWLDDDVDWDEAKWFDSGGSRQDAALGFFSGLDTKVRKALGVVIIEGEHPSSSYYAVELRNEITSVNQAAQALGLVFRFRAEGGGAAAEPASSPVVASAKGAGV